MAVKYIGRDGGFFYDGRKLRSGDIVGDDSLASRFDFEPVEAHKPAPIISIENETSPEEPGIAED